jgi:hypothetical protein
MARLRVGDLADTTPIAKSLPDQVPSAGDRKSAGPYRHSSDTEIERFFKKPYYFNN